jgi:AbrB family looped-hinge helix DNA binding protein
MPPSSTISSRGQITVPLEVRKRLGFKPGDRVAFVLNDHERAIRPVRAPENPFAKYICASLPFLTRARTVRGLNNCATSILIDENRDRQQCPGCLVVQ